MPLYRYQCSDCGYSFVVLKGKPSNTEICENCGGEARKVISPVGIMFKGSGYYTTDYRKSRDKKDKGKED